ncbi:phage tail protein [Clostridium thermosuccinogenes]|uniref:phage tail-collar fiber domain-containing protein n=1 Tax=Clostridium thermosuccinogenes TaxID=84032 RepID=UPI001930ECE4|nr:phage tail protein [Pseudoclostridium thermosuccinogenes]
MSFGLIAFTNRGRALQAKAQAGTQLNFTRIAVGDGQLSGQAIADLTALVHEVKSITLNKFKTMTDGKVVIGGVLSNQDIAAGFYWRELGLFAQDPDLGEILYCYGNAGDLAEYIPSPGGSEIIEKQVDIVTIVGNASSVTATIDQSLVYETIIGAQEKADAARTAANNYTDQKFAVIAEDLASHNHDNRYLGINANAVSASKLQTARTISLTGDVTGSVSFNGESNVSMTTTVADDSHNHSINTITNLQSTLDSKVPKSGTTMTGVLVAQNNTSYTTKQVRNIILSTSNPSGGNNGDIWIKYK